MVNSNNPGSSWRADTISISGIQQFVRERVVMVHEERDRKEENSSGLVLNIINSSIE
jgi:hypothetical protein